MALIRNTTTEAQHDWPEDVMVQGGKGGLVFRAAEQGGSYTTAFVEAFPGGTFLRGEGKTVADAETACWKQYLVYAGCQPHGPYERRSYRNGAGFCIKCGTWMSNVFEPLPEDPDRQPSRMERFFRGDPDALLEVATDLVNIADLPNGPGGHAAANPTTEG